MQEIVLDYRQSVEVGDINGPVRYSRRTRSCSSTKGDWRTGNFGCPEGHLSCFEFTSPNSNRNRRTILDSRAGECLALSLGVQVGFRHTEGIDVWVPVFLFSVLFGLSMDHHVFLPSCIGERYVETNDDAGGAGLWRADRRE